MGRRRDRAPAGRLRDVWRPHQGSREPASLSGLGGVVPTHRPRGGSGGAAIAEALGPRKARYTRGLGNKLPNFVLPVAAKFLLCSYGVLLKSGQPGCDHACPVFVRNPRPRTGYVSDLGIQPPELVSRRGFCRSRFFFRGSIYCPVESGLSITFAFSSFPE